MTMHAATATAPVLRSGPAVFSDVTNPDNTLIIMDITMRRRTPRNRPPVNITIRPATVQVHQVLAAGTTEDITADIINNTD